MCREIWSCLSCVSYYSKYSKKMWTVIYGAPYVRLQGFYLHIVSRRAYTELSIFKRLCCIVLVLKFASSRSHNKYEFPPRPISPYLQSRILIFQRTVGVSSHVFRRSIQWLMIHILCINIIHIICIFIHIIILYV